MQTLRVVSLLAFSIALVACGGSTSSSDSSNPQGNNPQGNNPNANAVITGARTTDRADRRHSRRHLGQHRRTAVWAVGENGIIHYDGTKWDPAVSNAPMRRRCGAPARTTCLRWAWRPRRKNSHRRSIRWDGSQWTLSAEAFPEMI